MNDPAGLAVPPEVVLARTTSPRMPGHLRLAFIVMIAFFALGVIEGLTKYFYPEASNTVVFVLMVLVLLVKPTGLTGRAA